LQFFTWRTMTKACIWVDRAYLNLDLSRFLFAPTRLELKKIRTSDSKRPKFNDRIIMSDKLKRVNDARDVLISRRNYFHSRFLYVTNTFEGPFRALVMNFSVLFIRRNRKYPLMNHDWSGQEGGKLKKHERSLTFYITKVRL
jgi:CYTH domain-containing protein